MSHQVVYRKYRSQNFGELIGQEHIAKTLSNQVKTDSIGHAYLFFGPRGCGKTSTARIFSKIVNCQNPIDDNGVLLPCGVCESCKNFTSDDMDIIEMDAASNRGIDDARLLRDKAYSQPISHKYKVVILDEAHMLTREAVNALLKIIEEPPEYMIFIFCTTEFHKIPITIASRCQRFKFLLANKDNLIKKLKYICEQEGKNLSDEQLEVIALLAKGSFRDSESLLEQIINSGDDNFLKDLYSQYNEDSLVGRFVDSLTKHNLESIWSCLVENEENQSDVKQLLELSLEFAKRQLDKKAIDFNQYAEILKIVGSFRSGGKEEFIFSYSMINDKKQLNENPQRINASPQQTQLPTASVPVVTIQQKDNVIKTPEIRKESPSVTPMTIKNEEKPIGSNVNIADVMDFLKDKGAIFNILQNCTMEINNNNLYIYVKSTVSKLILTKNNIAKLVVAHYQGKINDVKIELVRNDQIPQHENVSKVEDNGQPNPNDKGVPNDIEKIFGSKFQ